MQQKSAGKLDLEDEKGIKKQGNKKTHRRNTHT